MSFLRNSHILTPTGKASVESLKKGDKVLKRSPSRWIEATVKSVSWRKCRRIKMAIVVEDPVMSLTVSDDNQFSPECGDYVMCSEGAHCFKKQIGIVETTVYLEPVDMVQVEIERHGSVVVDGFLVFL